MSPGPSLQIYSETVGLRAYQSMVDEKRKFLDIEACKLNRTAPLENRNSSKPELEGFSHHSQHYFARTV